MISMIWDKQKYNKIKDYFFRNSEKKYLEFNKKICNSNYPMIGVRTNYIKRVAKEVAKTDVLSFFLVNENKYYEEVLLEGFVISNIKDFDVVMQYFNKYLDKVDCWAICDMLCSSMKIVKKHKEFYLLRIEEYLKSEKQYIVRVGIVLLLQYYIEDKYLNKIFEITDSLNREEYYIKMAVSWLLSICYIKYQKETETYLKKCKLDSFTYNKTISKICDSYRVNKVDKERLKKTRR